MTTLAIDHVILATADMAATAARLEREHGLASLPGGRHAGHGTGNRIVPLGNAYIEIMGIVDEDEAAASPMGGWLREQTAAGDRVAALCLRTDGPGFDTTATRLGLRPQPMARDAPGGVTLSWRLAGLGEAMADPSRTFFIDWQVPPEQPPRPRGRAPPQRAQRLRLGRVGRGRRRDPGVAGRGGRGRARRRGGGAGGSRRGRTGRRRGGRAGVASGACGEQASV